MKRQRTLKFIGMAVILLALAAEGVLIYHMRDPGRQNVVTVGRVTISLKEPEYETDTAIVMENVKPGQRILRDPTIIVENGSQMAYVRTRIVVKGLPEYQKKDLLEEIALKEGWNYNRGDGYYYYKNPVAAGEEIPFFTSVTVPEQWQGMEEGLKFQISVFAEAVQASYLTPNISADCRMLGWIPTERLIETKSGLSF